MLALVVGAVQVAYDFGDGDQITGVDLLLIFLRTARPHGAFDLGLTLQGFHRMADHVRAAERAHANFCRLMGGDPQRHLVFLERDHEQLQRDARDFLLFDRDDLTNAMRRINNEFIRAEI